MIPLSQNLPPRKPCLFIYPKEQSPLIYTLPDEDILKIFELAVNQANPSIEDLYTCSSLRKTSHRFRQISGDIILKINCGNVSLNKSDVKYLRHLRGIPLTLTNNFHGNIDLDNDIDDFIVFFKNNLVNSRDNSTNPHLLSSLRVIKDLLHTSFSHELGIPTAFSIFRDFISNCRLNFSTWSSKETIKVLDKTTLFSFRKLIYEMLTIFTRNAPYPVLLDYLKKCRELDEKNYEKYAALFLYLYVRRFQLPPDINSIFKIDDFKSAMGLASRGYYYFISENYEQALADLSEAITLNPEDAFALSLRGKIYRKKGEPSKALEDFNNALQIIPYSSKVLTSRADVFFQRGQFDKALKNLNNALSITPNNADALMARADVYRKKNNLDAALADINHSLTINPNHAGALKTRADIYLKKNNPDAALADINCSLEINPDNVNALIVRINIYLSKRNREAALVDLNHVLTINPNIEEVLIVRINIYSSTGNLEAALVDLNHVLTINPNNEKVLITRILTYIKTENFEAALVDLNRYLTIQPNSTSAINKRNMVLQILAKKNEALQKESSVNPQEDQDELSLDLEDRSITSNSNKRSGQKSESSPKRRQPEDAEGN